MLKGRHFSKMCSMGVVAPVAPTLAMPLEKRKKQGEKYYKCSGISLKILFYKCLGNLRKN